MGGLVGERRGAATYLPGTKVNHWLDSEDVAGFNGALGLLDGWVGRWLNELFLLYI